MHGEEESSCSAAWPRGGKAMANKLTLEQRKEAAGKAAQARWAQEKKS
jgi:hypothetical protein